jgi:hypothetical protein
MGDRQSLPHVMNKRPLSVAMIGYLYIAVGAIGFAYHFSEFRTRGAFPFHVLWIELIRLVAIVCGAFLLRNHSWARWLAVAWIGFHVVMSALHSLPELAIHCLFFAVIAWSLFRPEAAQYFRSRSTGQDIYGNPGGR